MKGLKDIGQYKRVTATGVIVPVGGTLLRYICSTTGTIQITEGVAGGGNDIISSFAVTGGQVYVFGMDCPAGAWCVNTTAVGTFVVG